MRRSRSISNKVESREPIDHRGVGFPVIDSILLHATMYVQMMGLVLVYLSGEDTTFASESPD